MKKNINKIQIKNLEKSFGTNKVLNKLNLDVKAGESVVVIGGSGTGKSVLLKCILNLLVPEKGSILIDGVEQVGAKESEVQKSINKIGTLFQGAALFDSIPVWENVAFRLIYHKGVNRKEAKEIAVDKLHTLGMEAKVADLWPNELSGGMKKRVALARAIADKPEIIFFDEPTTGLDPIMGDVINNLIHDIVKKLGATAISITHDISSARKIADRIALLYEGRIIWDGSVNNIDNSGNPYVEQFINGRSTGPIKVMF